MQKIYDLLRECTFGVSIHGTQPSDYKGTAFTITKDLLITCAHIFEDVASNLLNRRDKSSKNYPKIYINEIYEIEELWLFVEIDIAILKCNFQNNIKNPKCVKIDEDVEIGDKLLVLGYSMKNIGYDGRPATTEVEGWTFLNRQKLIKLKQGQIEPGMSGGPVLNMRTGNIIGVIKRTRDENSDLGGDVITITDILERVPNIKEMNRSFHNIYNEWSDNEPVKKIQGKTFVSFIIGASIYRDNDIISSSTSSIRTCEKFEILISDYTDTKEKVIFHSATKINIEYILNTKYRESNILVFVSSKIKDGNIYLYDGLIKFSEFINIIEKSSDINNILLILDIENIETTMIKPLLRNKNIVCIRKNNYPTTIVRIIKDAIDSIVQSSKCNTIKINELCDVLNEKKVIINKNAQNIDFEIIKIPNNSI